MEILKNPLLPEGNVTSVICGNHPKLAEMLRNRGVEAVTLADDNRLPFPVRNHADMQCCHAGVGKIFTSNIELPAKISNYSINLISEIPSDIYPNDCLLNCFVINGVLVTGKNCSESVIEFADKNSLEIRTVNQGYAKCSTAIISSDAVITADKTVAAALENYCSVQMIDHGHIILEGYNYGFIGGTCGKLAKDKLAFYGNPFRHPDGKRIISFAEENNCEVISLQNGELIDFGGFIPLYEKNQ